MNFTKLFSPTVLQNKNVSIYPISSDNLEGIKILIDNIFRVSNDIVNNNVEVATVSPKIWLNEFLSKHLDKIKYVCNTPIFSIMSLENEEVHQTTYEAKSISFSENDLDEFLNTNRWRKLVLFYIIKTVDLRYMKVVYSIKYADISKQYEVRDNKLNEILKDGTDNN
jgi:hypothetical protein